MAKPKAPAADQYEVVVSMMHNGKLYRRGDMITLSDEERDDILALPSPRIKKPGVDRYNRRDMRPDD